MAEKISAKKFFDDFNKITLDNKAKILYQTKKPYTKFVTLKICELIKKYNLTAKQEYYRIDAIGYDSHYEDAENKDNAPLATYAWDLKIAVEHENDDNLWMDEVVKLAHICCDLRVVIGYLPMKKRATGEDEKCLEYIVAVMKKHCKCFDNLKNKDNEFMIIIGNSGTDSKRPETYFNYKGYAFNPETEKFELI